MSANHCIKTQHVPMKSRQKSENFQREYGNDEFPFVFVRTNE